MRRMKCKLVESVRMRFNAPLKSLCLLIITPCMHDSIDCAWEKRNRQTPKPGLPIANCRYKFGDTWNPKTETLTTVADASFTFSHLMLPRSDETTTEAYEPHRNRFLWFEKNICLILVRSMRLRAAAKCKIRLSLLIPLLNGNEKDILIGVVSILLSFGCRFGNRLCVLRTRFVPGVISCVGKRIFHVKRLISREAINC